MGDPRLALPVASRLAAQLAHSPFHASTPTQRWNRPVTSRVVPSRESNRCQARPAHAHWLSALKSSVSKLSALSASDGRGTRCSNPRESRLPRRRSTRLQYPTWPGASPAAAPRGRGRWSQAGPRSPGCRPSPPWPPCPDCHVCRRSDSHPWRQSAQAPILPPSPAAPMAAMRSRTAPPPSFRRCRHSGRGQARRLARRRRRVIAAIAGRTPTRRER
jgi:hypothetical protein